MGNLFGSKTSSKSNTQFNNKQTATSQGNLAPNAGYQDMRDAYFAQYGPGQVDLVNTAPTAYQYDAANNQTGTSQGLGELAVSGLNPTAYRAYMDPFEAEVIEQMRGEHAHQQQVLADQYKGSLVSSGALGNDTGGEAALRAELARQQGVEMSKLYQTGFESAWDKAQKDYAARTAAYGQGTQANVALNQIGEQLRQAGLQDSLLPFYILSQGASGLGSFSEVEGKSGSGTAEGTQQTQTKGSSGPLVGNILGAIMGGIFAADGGRIYAGGGAVRPEDAGFGYYDDGGSVSTSSFFNRVAEAKQAFGGGEHFDAGGRVGFYGGGDTSFADPFDATVGDLNAQTANPSFSSTKFGKSLGQVGRNMSTLGLSGPGGGSGFEVLPYDNPYFPADSLRGFPNGIGFDVMEQTSTRDPGSYASAPAFSPEMIHGALRNADRDTVVTTTPARSSSADDDMMFDAVPPRYSISAQGLTSRDVPGALVTFDEARAGPQTSVTGLPLTTTTPERSPFAPPPVDPRSTRQTYTPTPPPELTPPRERPPYRPALELIMTGLGGSEWSPGARDVASGLGRIGTVLGGITTNNPISGLQAVQARRESESRDFTADRHAAQLHDQLRQTQHHQTETDRYRAVSNANTMEHQLATEAAAMEVPATKAALAMGLQRGTPEFAAMVEKLMKTNQGERALDTARAKNTAEAEQAARASIAASERQMADLNQMAGIASNPNVYFGPGGGMVNTAKAIAKTFGMQFGEGAAEGEVYNSLANQMALQLRNPAGGAGMPGAMSDQDRNFLVSMVPGLSRTREGNQLLLQMWREKEAHKLAEAREQLAFMQQNGSQVGLENHMREWNRGRQEVSAETVAAVRQHAQRNPSQVTTPAQEGALSSSKPWNDLLKLPDGVERQAQAIDRLRTSNANTLPKAVNDFNAAFNSGKPGLAESLLTDEQKAALPASSPQQQPGSQQPRGILEEMLNPTPTPLGNWLREKLGVPPVPIPGQQQPQPTPNVRGPQ